MEIKVKRIIIKPNSKKHVGRPDYSLDFEFTARSYFGDKAYHIADHARNPKEIQKWLLKIAKQIIKDINQIETTPRHRKILLLQGENVLRNIKLSLIDSNLIFSLFKLISSILGYDYMDGKKFYNLIYTQDNLKYFESFFMENPGKSELYLNQKQSITTERQGIINDLKRKKYDNFQISAIMNITEYEVTKTLSKK